MSKEEFISSGLLEQYALGTVSLDERGIVEDYLSQYPDIKQELNEIEEALENYAMSQAENPGNQVKERLMKQLFPSPGIEEESEAKVLDIGETRKTSFSFYKMAAAAMLVLLIGSVVIAYNFYEKYQNTQNDLASARQTINEQAQANQSLTGNLDMVTDKYSQSVVLKGTPQAPGATAKIFWMRNTGQVYVDYRDLPTPPAGKQYQLWAIVEGKPVDAGMIATEKGTYTIQKMKSFGKADAFAITLEKTGGSPTPTMSEMVVISEL